MMRHLKLSIEGEIVRAIEGVDIRGMPYCRREQSEFIVPLLLPARPMADQLFGEVEVLVSDVNRNYVPGHKKGGSASFYALLNQAPAILSLPVHFSQVSRSRARTASVSDYDARH
jgi:hypothetical protein